MDLSEYKEEKPHRVKRLLWVAINATIFRCLLGPLCRTIRIGLLRLFGASIHPNVEVYPSAVIFAPWNLIMKKSSCIGPKTEIYNKAIVTIEPQAVVSQVVRLYTASHDITSATHDLVTRPITLGKRSWVAAEAFIGMGVTVGEGAVVGARAAVFKDVEPWTVVGGNPAKFIKKRIIKDA